MLADYGFVYLYWATVNTKVRPGLDGEDCRRVLRIFGYITYYLLLLLSHFEITAPVSASAQSDAGRRYYFGPYRVSISSKQLQNTENSKIFN